MKIRLLIGVCALSVWLGGEALAAQLVRQGTPHEALFSLAFEGDRGFAAGSLGSLYESLVENGKKEELSKKKEELSKKKEELSKKKEETWSRCEF